MVKNMDLVSLKQRYGIVGHSPLLDRAIHIAVQVASTDLSVLVIGESGVGKENFPKMIHDYSACKHGPYIAVNCGAIPEGTIDSELFGHEKGSFTGAFDTRKGYFEVADGGTIFLDEVADLPMATQVRLLRVLETGDFIKVGSSKVQKTKVRIIAATNVNIGERIARGKFREDLYYRLNTVPIHVPALRERGDDVALLFLKFSSDFAAKYRFPQLELTAEASEKLKEYYWPGNIRQLKNVTEQMSLIEQNRLIDAETLEKYLVHPVVSGVPALIKQESVAQQMPENFERELIFKFLADMKREVGELRNMVTALTNTHSHIEQPVQNFDTTAYPAPKTTYPYSQMIEPPLEASIVEDNYSIIDTERELIKKALEKHNYRRKQAAEELGISERTLYRKINDYNL
jgi:DNA-binding NtrC family response regulator